MSGSWPIQPCQSLRQIPLALTRTTTPSTGGAGSATAHTCSGPANCSKRTAFTVARLPAGKRESKCRPEPRLRHTPRRHLPAEFCHEAGRTQPVRVGPDGGDPVGAGLRRLRDRGKAGGSSLTFDPHAAQSFFFFFHSPRPWVRVWIRHRYMSAVR